MKKVILTIAVSIFLIAANEVKSFGQATQQQVDGLNQSNDNNIQLFNGENLDGWYTFLKDRGRDKDPKNVFTVTDGMIRISGEEWVYNDTR